MSNYTVATNFGAKDALSSGNPAKLILGAQLTTEFNNIATAIASKPDLSGAAFTGAVSITGGTFTSRGIADNATANALTIDASGNVLIVGAASNVLNVGNNSVTGQLGVILNNTSAANGDTTSLAVSAGASNFRIIQTNAANSSAQITNGPTGAQTIFRTLGAFPLVFGTSNAMAGFFDGTTQQLNLSTAGTASPTSFGPVYAGVPQNLQNVNYGLVLSDANKHLYHSSGAAHTYTIPANASVAFPVGTAITFINNPGGGVVTIAITTDTLTFSPSGGSGTRSLAAAGMATAIKISATGWQISGTGIT